MDDQQPRTSTIQNKGTLDSDDELFVPIDEDDGDGSPVPTQMDSISPAGVETARTYQEEGFINDENVSPNVKNMLISIPPELLRGQHSTMPGERPKPGLNRSVPPISRIDKIFDDLATKAQRHGFDNFLRHIGTRELRVATMCSGTESPLLALGMIQDSMY